MSVTEDIDKFNEHKLKLWVEDSIERYKMADLSDTQAIASTLSVLMFVLAQAVAITKAPATETADRLLRAIDGVREYRRRNAS